MRIDIDREVKIFFSGIAGAYFSFGGPYHIRIIEQADSCGRKPLLKVIDFCKLMISKTESPQERKEYWMEVTNDEQTFSYDEDLLELMDFTIKYCEALIDYRLSNPPTKEKKKRPKKTTRGRHT